MNWVIDYLPEARKDMQGLDHSVQTQVLKGIRKVAKNPVSVNEGGYGKPLGNKNGNDLTGLFKIKFQNLGLLVVYQLIISDTVMKIIVVSARTDEQVYKEAARRRMKHEQ